MADGVRDCMNVVTQMKFVHGIRIFLILIILLVGTNLGMYLI